MKKRILLLVVTIVVLGLVYLTTLAAESIPTRFIEITENTVNIRTGPSKSTTIVAQAKKGDIFELKGETNGWYKIDMFSGEYRYVYKSLSKLTTYTIFLPSSTSIRQKIFNLLGEAEDRAMDEADQKYPMNIPDNVNQNIDYGRLLIDKYELKIFHEFKVQPVIYGELIVEVIKEQQTSVSSENTLERAAEKVAIEVFGKTVNWDNKPYTIKKIVMIKQVSGPDEGSYLIEICYRANENLTVGWIRSGIFIDAKEFTEKLYQDPNCKEIKIYMLKPYLILTNKYGKEKEEQVAKLVLRRAVANKINWENITNDMFERILKEEGQLWLHPALGN